MHSFFQNTRICLKPADYCLYIMTATMTSTKEDNNNTRIKCSKLISHNKEYIFCNKNRKNRVLQIKCHRQKLLRPNEILLVTTITFQVLNHTIMSTSRPPLMATLTSQLKKQLAYPLPAPSLSPLKTAQPLTSQHNPLQHNVQLGNFYCGKWKQVFRIMTISREGWKRHWAAQS